jgi:hypothetical protein
MGRSINVHIRSEWDLRARFGKLIEDDPTMAEQTTFFMYLLSLAGRRMDLRLVVTTLRGSTVYVTDRFRVDLNKIVDALIHDEKKAQMVKDGLTRIGAAAAGRRVQTKGA